MNLSRYAYLFTDFLFAGTALIIIWHRHRKFLKKHWEFVFDFMLFSVPFAYLDVFATRWGAWEYNPSRNLQFYFFGAPLEVYIFMVLVAAAVASYTISQAKVYGLSHPRFMALQMKNKKRRSSKTRKVSRSFATTRR